MVQNSQQVDKVTVRESRIRHAVPSDGDITFD